MRRFLVLLSLLFIASSAQGQVQPTPIYLARSTPLKLFDNSGSGISAVLDVSAYSEIEIVLIPPIGPCIGTGPHFILVQGSYTASGTFTTLETPNATHYARGDVEQYRVAGLPSFVRLNMALQLGCTMTMYVTATPVALTSFTSGSVPDGQSVGTHSLVSPVIGGGVGIDPATGLPTRATSFRLDANSHLWVGGGIQPATDVAQGLGFDPQILLVGGVDDWNLARFIKTTNDGTVVVSIGGSSGSTVNVAQLAQTYTPAVPTVVNLAANVSGAITGLTAGSSVCYACNVASAFRTGTGTPTALSTDNDISANQTVCKKLPATHTAFAFISSSAGTCKVGVVLDTGL